jgi:hypothetical protein
MQVVVNFFLQMPFSQGGYFFFEPVLVSGILF